MAQIPQYNVAEFVDSIAFNNGSQNIINSIREPLSGVVFFAPGVVNPNSLAFTFNGNLTVSLNAPSPFKCLFQSGGYMGAHGTTIGVDSSAYIINFASLVPSSGPPITAYIVATSGVVQLDSTPITGPPPGHPDFNAAFIPYIGYTVLQDTLNITATTIVPDNVNTIELARTTLYVGQTSVVSVDTSHQVLAHVITPATIPVAGSAFLGSSANVSSSAAPIFSATITLPSLGLWRIMCDFNCIIQFYLFNNGLNNTVAAYESWVTDNTNTWAHCRGTTRMLFGPSDVDTVESSGFGISPPYAGGSTVTLYAEVKSIPVPNVNVIALQGESTVIHYWLVSADE